MRLTIPQADLADATRWAARQIPGKPTYPAMLGARLEADDNGLRVSVWDGVTAAHADLDCDVEEAGLLVAPGQMLADVVGSLRKSEVTLAGQGELAVTAEGAEFHLPCTPAHDYPALPGLPETGGTVDGAEFAAAFKRVQMAVSRTESGSSAGMRGVRMVADEGELELVATDRYRIAFAYVPWAGDTAAPAMGVVPGKALADNAAVTDGPLRLGMPANGAGTAALIGDRRSVSTALMDWDTFPHAVHNVSPSEKTITGTVVVDAEELAAAVAAATAVGDASKPIYLTITGDRMSVRGEGEGRSRLNVGADYQGDRDEYELKLAPRYFTDALGQFTGATHIDLTLPAKPFVIHNPDDASYRHVVMPLRPLT